MEIAPSAYYDKMKRLWRRRKYQRLNSSNKNRKLTVVRLGRGGSGRPTWKPRRAMPIICRRLKMASLLPFNLLLKFHDAYINMMIRVTNDVNNLRNAVSVSSRARKRVKSRQVCLLSTGEQVDAKLVMEIYKRYSATRDLTVV